MTLLKKLKMEKITSKIPNELYVIETLTKLQYYLEQGFPIWGKYIRRGTFAYLRGYI